MPPPVSLVTIHHEGAGSPSDVARGASGGYTYWIGSTYFTHLRTVWSSFGTYQFNGQSLDVCLSGNRMEWAVSDSDITIIRNAVTDARSRGYVVNAPTVRAHRNSPGSSTVCPGDKTMERWSQIVAACTAGATPGPTPPKPPEDDDMPKDKDTVDRLVTAEGTWDLQYDGGVKTIRGPFYGSYFSLPANVRNDPARRFLTIAAPGDGSAKGYDLISTKGESYGMRTRQ